jgi:integrase
MSVKLRKRKRTGDKYSLFLDVYSNGKRKFEYLNLFLVGNKSLDRTTLELAENQRAKRQIELQYDSFDFVAPSKKKENFVDYFQKLVDERPKDRSSWTCTLKKIKEFTNGYVRFIDIDDEWLEGFKRYLLNSKIEQITAYHYYSNFKYSLNRAVKEKILASNPCGLVDNIKKPETKREYLTLEEIKKLIDTPLGNKDVKDAFLFSCFTGLRYSDVLNLKWDYIRDNRIEYTQKKTKSIEYLPLSKTALNILHTRRPESVNLADPIFVLPSKPVTWWHIKNWVEDAKIIKRVSFHTARHSFATLSLTQGIDLYTVSKLLGHKDISTTQIYAKIIDQKKQEAIDKLPELVFA